MHALSQSQQLDVGRQLLTGGEFGFFIPIFRHSALLKGGIMTFHHRFEQKYMCPAGVSDNVALDPSAWRPLYSAEEPHKVPLPGLYNNIIDAFRKLLLVRSV
jgi:hypothetical protein